MKKWTSIILAGGESRRMGQPKPLLRYKNKSVIEYLVEVIKPFSDKIIIIHRLDDQEQMRRMFYQDKQILCYTDSTPFQGEGPLAGIYTGMSVVQSPWYYVTACDLLYLDTSFLQGLHRIWQNRSKELDAFIPISEGRLQPLSALYRYQAQTLNELLLSKERRVNSFIQELQIYRIEQEEWSTWTKQPQPFFNMNRWQDYEAVLKEEEHDA